jgi:hypothetical protein
LMIMAEFIWHFAAAIRAHVRAPRYGAADSIGLSRRACGIRSKVNFFRESAQTCGVVTYPLMRSASPSVHDKTENEKQTQSNYCAKRCS